MFLQSGQRSFVNGEAELFSCNFLRCALVWLEEVVIQILCDIGRSVDAAAVGSTEDSFQFGQFRLLRPILNGLRQLVDFLDTVAIQLLQNVRYCAVHGLEYYLIPRGGSAGIQCVSQFIRCGGKNQRYQFLRLSVGFKGISSDE